MHGHVVFADALILDVIITDEVLPGISTMIMIFSMPTSIDLLP